MSNSRLYRTISISCRFPKREAQVGQQSQASGDPVAPRKQTLAGSWRGPKPETFTAITWHPANRARHEADYPDRPRFTAAELADWSRIFKRIDIEHPKPGKNSFQALIGRRIVGTDLLTRSAVYLVAYTQSHGIIEVISIRFADTQERAIFFA